MDEQRCEFHADFAATIKVLAKANADGTLDTFEMFFASGSLFNPTGVVIGTFSGSGTAWNDRDYESIGNVTKGSKQTFTGKNCDVVTDDILGIYYATAGAMLEANSSGGSGYLDTAGSKFGGGEFTLYVLRDADGWIGIYATGTTPTTNNAWFMFL